MFVFSPFYLSMITFLGSPFLPRCGNVCKYISISGDPQPVDSDEFADFGDSGHYKCS